MKFNDNLPMHTVTLSSESFKFAGLCNYKFIIFGSCCPEIESRSGVFLWELVTGSEPRRTTR